MLPNEQFRFSYIARLETEVGVLEKQDLEAILKKFPKMRDELGEKALKIKEHRQAMKEEEDRMGYSMSNHSLRGLASKQGINRSKDKLGKTRSTSKSSK